MQRTTVTLGTESNRGHAIVALVDVLDRDREITKETTTVFLAGALHEGDKSSPDLKPGAILADETNIERQCRHLGQRNEHTRMAVSSIGIMMPS